MHSLDPAIDNVTERYVYDGPDIALVFYGTETLTHRYLHGPGFDEPLAEGVASVPGNRDDGRTERVQPRPQRRARCSTGGAAR